MKIIVNKKGCSYVVDGVIDSNKEIASLMSDESVISFEIIKSVLFDEKQGDIEWV